MSTATATGTTAEAYATCREITRTEARNFYYGIRLLPPVKRDALCALYALARRIDDIGDGDLPLAGQAVRAGVGAQGPRRASTPWTTRCSSRSPTPPGGSRSRWVPSRSSSTVSSSTSSEVRIGDFDELVRYCRLRGRLGRTAVPVDLRQRRRRPAGSPPATPTSSASPCSRPTSCATSARTSSTTGSTCLPTSSTRFGVELRLDAHGHAGRPAGTTGRLPAARRGPRRGLVLPRPAAGAAPRPAQRRVVPGHGRDLPPPPRPHPGRPGARSTTGGCRSAAAEKVRVALTALGRGRAMSAARSVAVVGGGLAGHHRRAGVRRRGARGHPARVPGPARRADPLLPPRRPVGRQRPARVPALLHLLPRAARAARRRGPGAAAAAARRAGAQRGASRGRRGSAAATRCRPRCTSARHWLRYRWLTPHRAGAGRRGGARAAAGSTGPTRPPTRVSFGDWLPRPRPGPPGRRGALGPHRRRHLQRPRRRTPRWRSPRRSSSSACSRIGDAADIGWSRVPLQRLHGDAAPPRWPPPGWRCACRTRVRASTGRAGTAGGRRGRTAGEESYDDVVLAAPPTAAEALLPPGALRPDRRLGRAARQLPDREPAPACWTGAVLDEPFVAAVDSPLQWVFDRTSQAGLEPASGGQYLAVSLSAADDLVRACRSPACRWARRAPPAPAAARISPSARSRSSS